MATITAGLRGLLTNQSLLLHFRSQCLPVQFVNTIPFGRYPTSISAE